MVEAKRRCRHSRKMTFLALHVVGVYNAMTLRVVVNRSINPRELWAEQLGALDVSNFEFAGRVESAYATNPLNPADFFNDLINFSG